jgi:hypothetical protein
VSFASPCCLPLVPGYLAYLAGLVGATPPPVSTVDGRPSGSAVGGEWRALLRCSSSDSPWCSPRRPWRCSGSPMPCRSMSICCNASVASSPSPWGWSSSGRFPCYSAECDHDTHPATACGALRYSAPSTAWARRRIWARRWP